MLTHSRHVFYDRDYHGMVLVYKPPLATPSINTKFTPPLCSQAPPSHSYDATNPKSKQSIARWRQEFLSFRAHAHPNRQYPELHVANKVDCMTADARQKLALQGQPGGSVWHMAASSKGEHTLQ